MENVRLKYKNNLDELLNYRRNKLTDEELEILDSKSYIVGKVCVIGTHIDETIIKSLF